MQIRFGRFRRWACATSLIWACGGTTFALGGCDSDTTTSVLGALETMTTSLVDVFFTQLAAEMTADDSTATTTTTDTST